MHYMYFYIYTLRTEHNPLENIEPYNYTSRSTLFENSYLICYCQLTTYDYISHRLFLHCLLYTVIVTPEPITQRKNPNRTRELSSLHP